MKKLFLFLALLLTASPMFGDADGLTNGTATVSGVITSSVIKTISNGSTAHTFTYIAAGTTATISAQIEGSTNNGGSYTICGTASTTLPASTVTCTGTYDHIRVNITALTGASPNVLWVLYTNAFSATAAGATPIGATGQAPLVVYPGLFVSYTPTQLGVNALTLPASSNSTNSNIIDTRGAKQVVLTSNCGQIYHILVTHYMEDGTTSANILQIVTSQIASTQCQLGITSDSANWGSCIGASGSPKMPQRAISFSFANTTATPSTCTARLFVAY